MSSKKNYDIAVLFDCISNSDNSSILIPKNIIEGRLEDDIFIAKDDNAYSSVDDCALDESCQCFGFPITLETIVNGKKLLDYNDEEREKLISTYLYDVAKYSYILYINDDISEIAVYKTDVDILDTAIINLGSDLYSAIEKEKTVAKSIKMIKNLPVDKSPKQEEIIKEKLKYKPKKDKEKPINVSKIYKKTTSNVLFQDEQIQQILTVIMKNQLINNPKIKSNILIAGPTGVGKTEIIRSLAKELNIPLVTEDATQYTIAGYVGKSVDDMLVNLYNQTEGNLEKAEKGIVFMDEIDKKSNQTNANDYIASKGVLDSLLKLMEDGKYQLSTKNGRVTFDTSKLTVIVAGAFSEIDKFQNKKIGFGSESISSEQKADTKINNEAFIRYGMPPEFLGRCQLKVFLNSLGVKELSEILRKSTNSHLVLNRNFLSSQGITFNYRQAIDEIAKQAYKLGTGARSLNEITENALSKATFEIFNNPNKYKSLTITSETIHDNSKYLLKRK